MGLILHGASLDRRRRESLPLTSGDEPVRFEGWGFRRSCKMRTLLYDRVQLGPVPPDSEENSREEGRGGPSPLANLPLLD